MYQYKAKLIKVVDGDTVDALIDCGFSTFKKERIRLHGINTPECRTRDKKEKQWWSLIGRNNKGIRKQTQKSRCVVQFGR